MKKEEKGEGKKFSFSGKTINKPITKSSEVTIEVHQRKLGLQKMDRDKSRFFK